MVDGCYCTAVQRALAVRPDLLAFGRQGLEVGSGAADPGRTVQVTFGCEGDIRPCQSLRASRVKLKLLSDPVKQRKEGLTGPITVTVLLVGFGAFEDEPEGVLHEIG